MDINEQLVLDTAWKTGHFWDVRYPDLLNVDQSSFGKLVARDKIARFAIASMQQADANFDGLVLDAHGRAPLFDGEIGPATMNLVQGWNDKASPLRRCPLPDFAPPPHASFHYDDPDLQAAVESMQRAANAPAIEGPYWRGCDPQRPDVHSLVIGIDITNAPSNWLANQEKILDARRRCAAEVGVAVRFVINPKSLEGLNQYQVNRPIAGGTIGLNYFPQTNSCGRIPNGSIDSSYNPSDWRMHAGLGGHESEGHGFGLNHTRGGRMNPSIILVDPYTWKGDPSWNTLVDLYGGRPIDQPPPQPPPVPLPVPDTPVAAFDLPAGRYELVRKGSAPVPPTAPPWRS